jgi:hypothetical protein
MYCGKTFVGPGNIFAGGGFAKPMRNGFKVNCLVFKYFYPEMEGYCGLFRFASSNAGIF